ncbi:unnamed protein product [Closterium sp. NIES-54]
MSLSVDSSASPPSSPASLPSSPCYTSVRFPTNFFPVVGSSADRLVADCFVVGLAAACSRVSCCIVPAPFADFTTIGCTSSACSSPGGIDFILTSTCWTSRWPPAMLLAGTTGDAPLLPSSPEADTGVRHAGRPKGEGHGGEGRRRERGHPRRPQQKANRTCRAEGVSPSRCPSVGWSASGRRSMLRLPNL